MHIIYIDVGVDFNGLAEWEQIPVARFGNLSGSLIRGVNMLLLYLLAIILEKDI